MSNKPALPTFGAWFQAAVECGSASESDRDLSHEAWKAALATQAEAQPVAYMSADLQRLAFHRHRDYTVPLYASPQGRWPTRERLSDSAIVDWLECRAMNGQVQIARSMFRTGYEIAVLEPQANKVKVYQGTLRQALESAVRGESR